MKKKLIFLKLGGSLITDKATPHTARLELIPRLGKEIFRAVSEDPSIQLLIGHGSGSFGHIPAKKYGTREGVTTEEQWVGFWEVWKEAQTLDRIVLDKFQEAGLRIITFPPSSMVVTLDHEIINWDTRPIQTAIQKGLIPMIYGDVVFDLAIGGTILSTEELFAHLADEFKPSKIILAGNETGVFSDFPKNKQLVPLINHENIRTVLPSVKSAAVVDVTGGMLSKLDVMWHLCEQESDLTVYLFSATKKNTLKKSLLGSQFGTKMQY